MQSKQKSCMETTLSKTSINSGHSNAWCNYDIHKGIQMHVCCWNRREQSMRWYWGRNWQCPYNDAHFICKRKMGMNHIMYIIIANIVHRSLHPSLCYVASLYFLFGTKERERRGGGNGWKHTNRSLHPSLWYLAFFVYTYRCFSNLRVLTLCNTKYM